MTEREVMPYDVVIVGAGPAGLAAAIRLKQLAAARNREVSVCVLEKGSEVGAHILSGAVIDPIALNELMAAEKQSGIPWDAPVTEDSFYVLSECSSWRIPSALLPPLMNNRGCYTASLGKICRWLGQEAEALGVEIYPGFAATEVLYDEQGAVQGVATGDRGIAKNGSPKTNYTRGIALHARYTLLAEGARGSLTRDVEDKFQLRADCEPQKYGLGFKELWQVDPTSSYRPGRVMHTQGWPLDNRTGGGAFVYHFKDNKVAIGLVIHLNYTNPHLHPFEEFQRFKGHPLIRPLLQHGKRLAYGARSITEGGLQSLPKLVFPGGALIGCAAGFVNVPRIKGSHNAMKSGMLAAEAAFDALSADRRGDELTAYPDALRQSWVWRDLDKVRNVKPALSRLGTALGTLYGGIDMWLHSVGVRLPWTLKHGQPDHLGLTPADQATTMSYPKHDNTTSFDRLSSLYLSNVNHEADQPSHLRLKDETVPITINLARYDAPEQRYCPAAVYEILTPETGPRLQINAANCIHCKACDIKDPTQNILWCPPEGGGGPNYQDM